MESNQIYRICGCDIAAMTDRLLKEADLNSMILTKADHLSIEDKHSIRIGIKPNLVSPTPADFGATTHPEIIESLIQYLQKWGFRTIRIMEGSWVGDCTEEAFELLGYRKLSEKYGVELIDTKKEPAETASAGELDISVCRCVKQTDFLINVPVLKGHCQTRVTCALKNMKGLIPDREKRRFHQLGLHRPIACLNTVIHQDFILVDDICGDPDFEDGGNPWRKNIMLAGTDPVLIDSYAARELGYLVSDVPYIGLAAGLGAGCIGDGIIDVRDIGPLSDGDRKDVPIQPYRRDESYLDVAYSVEESDTCSACYANLTEALFRLKEEGCPLNLSEKISIGQGMRKRSGRYGVGNCTSGFFHSIQGCPPTADEICKELKKWMKEEKKS